MSNKPGKPPARRGGTATHRGAFYVVTINGKVTYRKWPRRRGPPKSRNAKLQTQWFREANQSIKRAAPSQQVKARELTANTFLYPRDLLLLACAGNLFDIEFEDGSEKRRMDKRLLPMKFQGFILQLSANETFPNGVWTAPTWPLPILDTANFWDPTSPNEITIPEGVKVMQFFAGAAGVNQPFAAIRHAIWRNDAEVHAAYYDLNTSSMNATLATAPKVVTLGDRWAMKSFQTAAYDWGGGFATYFAGIVLGTEF